MEKPGWPPSSRLRRIQHCSAQNQEQKGPRGGFVFNPMKMQQIFEVAKRWQQQGRAASQLTPLTQGANP